MLILLLTLATALQVTPPAGGQPPVPTPTAALRVTATCDPCTVEVGRSSTIRADAAHNEGVALTYRWTASAGTVGDPSSRQARWTAPATPGATRLTVTVDDGRGGAVDASILVEVIAARPYTFVDVSFERNRATLGAAAMRLLGDIVVALVDEPSLSLQITGHSCAVVAGDPRTLGQRRADAVRAYLVEANVPASRLTLLSCGDTDGPTEAGRDEMRIATRRVTFVTSRPTPEK